MDAMMLSGSNYEFNRKRPIPTVCTEFNQAELKVIEVQEFLLPYISMTAASLLLIFVGGVLLFAPQKFIEFGHWWGKQIGFPRYSGKWDYGKYYSWRLPGLFLLCFGTFVFFLVLRSLLR